MRAAILLLGGISISACGSASEGEWRASVEAVSETGSPPPDLATAYDVVVTVDRLTSGGANECTLTASIEGLGELVAPGGAACDDQGFDGNVSGEGLEVSVEEVASIRLRAEDTTLTMHVEGKAPDWERVYEGEATHSAE